MAKNKAETDILISFQQGELDAVYLYQRLAELMKNEEDKKLMLSLARDEGKHASILKGYTGCTQLRPDKKLGNMVAAAYKVFGKKLLFPLMSKFEIDAEYKYRNYYSKYPEIAKIGADEIKHGNLLADMISLNC